MIYSSYFKLGKKVSNLKHTLLEKKICDNKHVEKDRCKNDKRREGLGYSHKTIHLKRIYRVCIRVKQRTW